MRCVTVGEIHFSIDRYCEVHNMFQELCKYMFQKYTDTYMQHKKWNNLWMYYPIISCVKDRVKWICICKNLVQTQKCSLLIMGPHIFQIKLCYLNSSVYAAWSEIQFEVHQVLISQKLKG